MFKIKDTISNLFSFIKPIKITFMTSIVQSNPELKIVI